ncbi:MATE family efflux transporter [Peptoniphilus equinus]|uniref:Multidrug export protein MepA n=1 Tax=Peptoniphilus equinus TaxID=3016343 RepID=A0ABY7QTX2_9FIRM|nr:MATE family efflux transporter [Peptoniphilus equinus]WBW50224.1 MATE family efflux transporter [Peptoniphilus equinus]
MSSKTKAQNASNDIDMRNPLGYESISKLLVSLAIPAIIANLVNALYNVVDQIFIGHWVGYMGNAATSVAFPLTTLCLAIGLTTGIGAASNFNLELGRGHPHVARETVGTAVTMLLGGGLIITVFILIFLEPLLTLFGATGQTMTYASQYAGITSFGIPFLMFSIGMNPLVRADRSPVYSMATIVTGALLNTILDPIFIGVFGWGIAGAAIATVIGQCVSSILLVLYLPRFKSIKLHREDFRPKLHVMTTVFSLGLTSFVFQFSNLIIQVTTNNLLKAYGAMSKYGSDIPIAAAGIGMKINVVYLAILLGLVQGSQPIFSYNYGADHFHRVKSALKLLLSCAFAISFVAFLVFQFAPEVLISIFGTGDPLYIEFATRFLRIFLFFVFINGFQISIATYFPGIGKPKLGAMASLAKQIIYLLPLLLILPRFMGIEGILYAGPIADFLAFITSAVLLAVHLKAEEKARS